MSPRAPAMAPSERRAHLIEATVPLLLEHGRAVTTGQIARAAGVAEGTIFRVFPTKEALIEQAIAAALDPEPYLASLGKLPRDGSLRAKLILVAATMQDRFATIFRLMEVTGVGPPAAAKGSAFSDRVAEFHSGYLREHEAELRRPVPDVMHYLRLLCFAGSHTGITHGRLLSTEEIVDLVLDGTRKAPPCCCG